jgi:hypothetical protein
MKKGLEIIIAVFVVALGLSFPVAAQDATYSCGAYGAGDYSSQDCSSNDDDGGGQSPSDSGVDSSNVINGGGVASGGGEADVTDDDTSDNTANPKDKEDGDVFSVIFAKLAHSWGWVALFGLFVIAGVVLMGLAVRKKRSN